MSPPLRPALLLSAEPQAVERGRVLLDRFDGWAHVRNGLQEIAVEREQWSGIPMPLEGMRLVVEPTYPRAKEIMAIGAAEGEKNEDAGFSLINSWHSFRHGRRAYLMRTPEGKIDWGLEPIINHGGLEIDTLRACDAWGIEQEARAVQLLGQMLRHRQFKQYLLTGMFLEESPRSGVHYLFRKLRPTLALSGRTGTMRILCALCLHPIAYYEGSWAGAMCPTDDVIAHLALMRGDEKMFWRRANQHPAYRREAGI